MTEPAFAVEADGGVPDGLLAAFERYERALMADDLADLDALFEDGPATLRGDAAGLLVGHDAIADFRRGRGGAPARRIAVAHVRVLGPDTAVIVAEVRPASGGRGLQTQVWRRTGGAWRIVTAHVASPAPAVDARVWRVVGTPLQRGADGGPLARRAVAVKDLFAIAGQRIGAGVPAYLAEAEERTETASAVRTLLDAGADVLGIARTDEFAYSIAGANPHTGTPPNGAVPGALPGGSSSGPASAVALGQAAIGLGTDTAGSVRVPASYQGLWGIRTTHGAVPRDGLLPLAPSFDTVGWLTRSGAELGDVVRVALGAGNAPAERFVVAPGLLESLDPAVRAAFDAGVATAGLDPEPVDLGDAAAAQEAFRVVQAFEAWQANGAWITAHPGALGDAVAGRFALAAAVSADEAQAARAVLAEVRERVTDLLAGAVLLLPAAASAAPSATADSAELDRIRAQTLRLTCFAGIAGAPAVAAPLLSVGGAPLGLCLVGAPGTDAGLVDGALGIEERIARAGARP